MEQMGFTDWNSTDHSSQQDAAKNETPAPWNSHESVSLEHAVWTLALNTQCGCMPQNGLHQPFFEPFKFQIRKTSRFQYLHNFIFHRRCSISRHEACPKEAMMTDDYSSGADFSPGDADRPPTRTVSHRQASRPSFRSWKPIERCGVHFITRSCIPRGYRTLQQWLEFDFIENRKNSWTWTRRIIGYPQNRYSEVSWIEAASFNHWSNGRREPVFEGSFGFPVPRFSVDVCTTALDPQHAKPRS